MSAPVFRISTSLAEKTLTYDITGVEFNCEDKRSDLAEAWTRTVVAAGTTAMRSQRIWDLTSQTGVNRRRERSTAATSVSRSLVTMAVEAPGGLDIDVPVLRLGNVNGHPLYLGPTFVITGTSLSDYVPLDLRTVHIEHKARRMERRATARLSVIRGDTPTRTGARIGATRTTTRSPSPATTR